MASLPPPPPRPPQQLLGHDFRWVCTALASLPTPPRLPLVDTVVVDRGRPALWLTLTGGDGRLAARRVGDGDTREIFAAFAAFSLGFPRNRAAQRCCVAHYSVGLPQVIDKATFQTHLVVGFLVATCIQPYVCAQGCARLPTNLRHEYLSTSTASAAVRDPSVPRVPVYQYVEAAGALLPGQPSFRMVPSALASPPIPDDVVARMQSISQQLVFYLQRARPSERIVKLITEFALDDNGQLWLVYTPDVRTEPNLLLALPPSEAEAPRDRPLPPPATVVLADGSTHFVHRVGLPELGAPVTIKDLVDLRNSPSPHPGLQAVGVALVQCVLGGPPRSWAKAVAVLRGTGCDEFVLRMRAIERAPQLLDEQRLEDLRRIVTSESFGAPALRRVGLLAETLGAWLQSITQAALECYACPGYGDLPLLQFVYGEAAAAALSRLGLLRVGAILANGTRTLAGNGGVVASALVIVAPPRCGRSGRGTGVLSFAAGGGGMAALALQKSMAVNPLSQPLTARSRRDASAVVSAAAAAAMQASAAASDAATSGSKSDALNLPIPDAECAGASAGSAETLKRRLARSPPRPSGASAGPSTPLPLRAPYPGTGIPGVTETGSFTLADSVTQVTFAIVGSREGLPAARVSLVIVHDFFDSLEGTARLLCRLREAAEVEDEARTTGGPRMDLSRSLGAHALLLNLPGQAKTSFFVSGSARPDSQPGAQPVAATRDRGTEPAGLRAAAGAMIGSFEGGSFAHNSEGRAPLLRHPALAEAHALPTAALAGPLVPPRFAFTNLISSGLDAGSRWAADLGSAAPGAASASLDGVHVPDPSGSGVLIGPSFDADGLPALPLAHAPQARLRPNSQNESSSASSRLAPASPAAFGSQLPSASPGTLSNEFLASALQQTLMYLDAMRLFPTSQARHAFDVVGLGLGASVALTWAARYGNQLLRRPDPRAYVPRDRSGRPVVPPPHGLRAVVSVNGWSCIDANLRTILDSTRTVFSTFSDSRLDLPPAFFSRFLFSDRYLSAVGREAAVAQYVAASEPSGAAATLEGRLMLLRGALSGTDVRRFLAAQVLPVPLVLVQSTDDALVAPGNARLIAAARLTHWAETDAEDPQRSPPPIAVERPLIVDEREGSGAGPTAAATAAAVRQNGPSPQPPEMLFFDAPLSAEATLRIAQCVNSAEGAATLLLRVRCGHELRQERPAAFLDLVRALIDTQGAAESAADLFFAGVGADDERDGGEGNGDGDAGQDDEGGGGGGAGGGGDNGSGKGGGDGGRGSALTFDSSGGGDRGQPSADEASTQRRAARARAALRALPERLVTAVEGAPRLSSADAAAYTAALPAALDAAAVLRSLLFEHNEPPAPTSDEASASHRTADGKAVAAATGSASALKGAELRLQRQQEARRKAWLEVDDAHTLQNLMRRAASERDFRERDQRAAALEAGQRSRAFEERQRTAWAEVADAPDAVPLPTLPLGPIKTDDLEFATKVLRDAELGGGFSSVETIPVPDLAAFNHIREEPFAILRRKEEAAEAASAEARRLAAAELHVLLVDCAIRVQCWWRAGLARRLIFRLRLAKLFRTAESKAVVKIQRLVRYRRANIASIRLRREQRLAWALHNAALQVQRVTRGFLARRTAQALRGDHAALRFQCAWRGFRDRMVVRLMCAAKRGMQFFHASATKIQSMWRMFSVRQDYRELVIVSLAATQVQRWVRGHRVRRDWARLLAMHHMAPGNDKVAAGFDHLASTHGVFIRSRLVMEKLRRSLQRADNELASARQRVRLGEGQLGAIAEKLADIAKDAKELADISTKTGAVTAAVAEADAKAARFAATARLRREGPAPGVHARINERPAPTKARTVPASVLAPLSQSGDYSRGTGGRIDGDFLRRIAIGLGGPIPAGLLSIVKGQDLTYGRSAVRVRADLEAQMSEMDFEIELAVRANYARKGRFHAELHSEMLRVAAELARERETVGRLEAAVAELQASIARNHKGMATIEERIDVLSADQRRQVELARPPVPPPQPSLAMIAALESRVLAVQAVSDRHARIASETAHRLTAGYAATLPAFVSSLAVVGRFKQLNFAALSNALPGGEESARGVLGPAAPGASLGAGMQSNTRVDFHHAVQRALADQDAAELRTLEARGGTAGGPSLLSLGSTREGDGVDGDGDGSRDVPSQTAGSNVPSKTGSKGKTTGSNLGLRAVLKEQSAGRRLRDLGDLSKRFDALATARDARERAVAKAGRERVDASARFDGAGTTAILGIIDTSGSQRATIAQLPLELEPPRASRRLVVDSAVLPLGRAIAPIGAPSSSKTHRSAGVLSSLESIGLLSTGAGVFDATIRPQSGGPEAQATVSAPALRGNSALTDVSSLESKVDESLAGASSLSGTVAATRAADAARAAAAGAAEVALLERMADARAAAARGPFPRKLRDWAAADVARFVCALALQQYAAAFEATGVDGEFLLQLTPKELKNTFGITDRSHLAALLHGREELRKADLRNDANLALRVLDPEAVAAVAGLQGASAQFMTGADAFRLPPLPAVFALAAAGRAVLVEQALRAGQDVHATDEEGNTLVIAAARGGHRRVLDLLFARGANVNAANTRGNTALHFVADPELKLRADSDGTLGAFLVARGANPEQRNAKGWRACDGLGEATLGGAAPAAAAKAGAHEASAAPRAPRRPNLLVHGKRRPEAGTAAVDDGAVEAGFLSLQLDTDVVEEGASAAVQRFQALAAASVGRGGPGRAAVPGGDALERDAWRPAAISVDA